MTGVSGKWVLAAGAVALALSASTALAAPFVYYDIRTTLGESHEAIVDEAHPTVLLSLYVFVLNQDGVDNDRWAYSTGKIVSSDSSNDPLHKLLGNLSTTGVVWAAGLDQVLSNRGTNGKTLDGDADFDVGFGVTGDTWFTATVGTVTSWTQVNMPPLGTEVIGGYNYTKFLIASGIEFTYMGTEPGDSTVVKYVPRAAAASQKVYSDTVYKSLHGGNAADVGSLEGVTITFVPEPATMALVALGGAAVLARRRRTR